MDLIVVIVYVLYVRVFVSFDAEVYLNSNAFLWSLCYAAWNWHKNCNVLITTLIIIVLTLMLLV
jgi:hypothetical protein